MDQVELARRAMELYGDYSLRELADEIAFTQAVIEINKLVMNDSMRGQLEKDKQTLTMLQLVMRGVALRD